MARVLNKHVHGAPGGAIYCGRGGKWGNPFPMRCEAERDAVIAQHGRWLATQTDLLKALDELRGKDLVCFCAPKRCHCDLLLRLANATRDERISWWRSARGVIAS